MLNAILRFSLEHRAAVLVVSLLIAIYGLVTAIGMPIDVLPNLNRPTVTILTEAHGMTPEDVELLVTWPIEQVVNGATGVVRVRSQSAVGLSTVNIEFDWDAEIYRCRQIVNEKLQLARARLPAEVQPIMAPVSSIMGQVQLIGFRSESGATAVNELRHRIDRDVRPRLLSLPGVSQVMTIGGQSRELQVTVNAERLRLFDVTLAEVAAAVSEGNLSGAGGTLSVGAKGPVVNVPGLLRNAEDLSTAVIKDAEPRPVVVSDVAEVDFGPTQIRTGSAGINGAAGVVVILLKQPGADTLALTEQVSKELETIADGLPADVEVIETLFQQSAFIERAVDNVLAAVRDGAVLVVVVLFMFLLNLRTTLITLTAIPLSIGVTALVFAAFDLGINTMTLGGLAVAIGILVDDAIVDVENVFRRLHENHQKAQPRPSLTVVFEACSEVRKPVLYGTILVTIVYLPLFFLTGIEGRLFAPIGAAYIVSVLASLGVALTVTPALCYYLLGRQKSMPQQYGGAIVRALHHFADRGVRLSLRHTAPILGVVVAAVVVMGFIMATRGGSFLPEFNEGSAQVNLLLPPDTNLEVSEAFGERLERVLAQVEGVAHVARRTGRALGDEHAMPLSVTEAIVSFDPAVPRGREEIIEEIRSRMDAEFPGVAKATEQPLAHLLSHLLSGVTAQVAIKIFGPDLQQLRQLAQEAESALSGIEGVRDLYVEPQVLIDQVQVRPRREDLKRHGMTVRALSESVELAMGGEAVSELPGGQLSYPIVVRLREQDRNDPHVLANLYVRRDDGESFLLSTLADVAMTKTPNNIQRENGGRRVVVQHNVAGRSLGDVVAEVERALEPIKKRFEELPGYSLRISGQFEAQRAATRLISLLSLFVLLGMFAVLALHFGSGNLALQVLVSIPMAFIGAVVLVVATQQVVSVATLVGLIALGGISARNGILLIDHCVVLLKEQPGGLTPELLSVAARERVVPVLMTALTSGVGLLPLALGADEPGREILYPVATVIIGGLVSSTLLDFWVRPGLLWRFGKVALESAAERAVGNDGEVTSE